MKKSSLIVAAAMTGIIGSAILGASTTAFADDMGHCMGANACKGKGDCKTAKNDCAGKNACKGKAWVKNTKAECDKLGAKNKKIKWEAAKG